MLASIDVTCGNLPLGRRSRDFSTDDSLNSCGTADGKALHLLNHLGDKHPRAQQRRVQP